MGKVFISYAHESKIVENTVFDLANRLRTHRIDAEIDQYEESPPAGWPKWMIKQIQYAEYVLVICTELLYNRADDLSGSEDGLGAKWETTLILQQLYKLNANNTKFIPVILNSDATKYIPLALQPYTYYNISNEENLNRLIKRLEGNLESKRPPLGNVEEIKPKERKSMFFSSIIDVELWNRAEWNGMIYMGDIDGDSPPILGFYYKSKEYGNLIFKQYKDQFGLSDKEEEIRISIIENTDNNNPHYYKVHIGSSWNVISKRMDSLGFPIDETYIMGISRFHNMNPIMDSRNLDRFKADYKKFNNYFITNVYIENGKYVPNYDNLIEKKEIYFRKKEEIITNKNDEDYVVFSKNYGDK